MEKRYLSKKLDEWYKESSRNLPWRSTHDPYKVWISEVILQQTRVDQGLSYYNKFIKKFPTVHSLAKADEEVVLRLWQGLGYYTRARNLHKCAKIISTDFGGKFPSSSSELKLLPGIGDYTAAAIASIAFNEKVAAVDGNVYRVLARLFGVDLAINSTAGKKHFAELANEIVPHSDPGTHNQAMMEFGALHCTPAKPNCTECIFKKGCIAYALGKQDLFPVKERNKKIKTRYFYYLVFQKGNSLLMKRREGKDIWKGLYDFPLDEHPRPTPVAKLNLEAKHRVQLGVSLKKASTAKSYKHVLSHQVIHCQFIHIKLNGQKLKNSTELKFYDLKKVEKLPKPVLIGRYLEDAGFL